MLSVPLGCSQRLRCLVPFNEATKERISFHMEMGKQVDNCQRAFGVHEIAMQTADEWGEQQVINE